MVFNSTEIDSKFLLLSIVLHAFDIGIITDGHEHGHGESRINKKIAIHNTQILCYLNIAQTLC